MGENKKVTIMVLKVDLQCEKCYSKVKKILCKFPQIQDQTYDEKNNQVIIKVVCCSPEKIRDKLCCKGRCVIKCINIIEPPPVKPESKPKPEPKPDPKPEPKPDPKPCLLVPCKCPCPRVNCPCPRVNCPRPQMNTCCTECNEGHPGGPCQTGYGYRVTDPCRQYDGYCGRPVYVSYGGYCVIRPDCFGEENPQACAIM